VKNVATCTLGGAGRQTLYVTTARMEAPEGDRLAGGLYAIPTEVAGQPETQFRAFGFTR
jgi:sugar lactone lactonase YvrE